MELLTLLSPPTATDLSLTEEERAIAEVATRFSSRVPEVLAQAEQTGPKAWRPLLAAAGELGLTRLDALLDGHSVLSSLLATEASGPYGAWAVTLGTHDGIGTLPFAWFGGAPADLEGVLAGTLVTSFALTEAGAGSDAAALSTTATADGSDHLLRGEKLYVSNAGIADRFIVFARVGRRISAFVVPRDTAGLEIGPEERKLGLHGCSTCAVRLDDVRVPATAMVGQPGAGLKIALTALHAQRLKLASAALGAMKDLLWRTVNHVRLRRQFGRPLIDFALVRARLASMAGNVMLIESAVRHAARRLEARAPEGTKGAGWAPLYDHASVEAAMLKVAASELLAEVADDAVQLHGGAGIIASPIERAYRDQRVQQIFEGTNEIHRLTIGTQFLRAVHDDDTHGGPAVELLRQVEARQQEGGELDQEVVAGCADLAIRTLLEHGLTRTDALASWQIAAIEFARASVGSSLGRYEQALSEAAGLARAPPSSALRDAVCDALTSAA